MKTNTRASVSVSRHWLSRRENKHKLSGGECVLALNGLLCRVSAHETFPFALAHNIYLHALSCKLSAEQKKARGQKQPAGDACRLCTGKWRVKNWWGCVMTWLFDYFASPFVSDLKSQIMNALSDSATIQVNYNLKTLIFWFKWENKGIHFIQMSDIFFSDLKQIIMLKRCFLQLQK
jgi:hypothetical protein